MERREGQNKGNGGEGARGKEKGKGGKGEEEDRQ